MKMKCSYSRIISIQMNHNVPEPHRAVEPAQSDQLAVWVKLDIISALDMARSRAVRCGHFLPGKARQLRHQDSSSHTGEIILQTSFSSLQQYFKSSPIYSNMEPISLHSLDYLLERAYHLVRVDLSCSTVFRTYFHDDVILRKWIDSIHIEISPKFLDIINSSCAPTADDFKELIEEYGYAKDYWTIYVLIMEK